MWTRLKLFILTATPTAILYALWLFSRRPKQKPPHNAIKSSTDEQGPQIVPTIEVTDTELNSQNEVSVAKSHKELTAANFDDSRLNSETESVEVNLDSQTRVNNTTCQSEKENDKDDSVSWVEVSNSDFSMFQNDVDDVVLKSQVDSIDDGVNAESEAAEVASQTAVNDSTLQGDRKDVAVSSVLQAKVTSDDAKSKVETSDIDVNSQTDGCNAACEMLGFGETQSVAEADIQRVDKCIKGIESEGMSRNVGEGCLLQEDSQNLEQVIQHSAMNKETLAMLSERSREGTGFTSDSSQVQYSPSEDLQTCDDIHVKAAHMENGVSVRSPCHEPGLATVGQVTENGLESLESVKSVENSSLSNAVIGSENSESGGDYVSESGSENQDKYAVVSKLVVSVLLLKMHLQFTIVMMIYYILDFLLF